MTCSGEGSSSIKVNQSSDSLRRVWILGRKKQQFLDHHGGLFYISNEIVLGTVWIGVGAVQGQMGKALGVMAEQAIV